MIRYRKLGYVELNVTDLKRSADFYEGAVGLQKVEVAGDGAYFRCDDDPYSVVLRQAEAAGYKRAGWLLQDEQQLDILVDRLRRADVPHQLISRSECQERLFAAACRTIEPYTGATLEFYVSDDSTLSPWTPSVARIQRLGHVVWSTPRLADSVAFFADILNFRESDSVGEFATFLRCFPSRYHHGVGLGQAPRAMLNHVNFMVSEIDDIGRAIHRFRTMDVPVVDGPGRHLASDSIYLYFIDPDGVTLEYSFGMEEFPEVSPREARKLPPIRDLWGGQVDPRFGKVGDIESYSVATD